MFPHLCSPSDGQSVSLHACPFPTPRCTIFPPPSAVYIVLPSHLAFHPSPSPSYPRPFHSPPRNPHDPTPLAFSFPTRSLSSNFRLAVRIISSLRRCSSACLSFLLDDQLDLLVSLPPNADTPGPPAAPTLPAPDPPASAPADEAWVIFEARLYRCIRSCCCGAAGAVGVRFEAVEGAGGGWKEGGG